MTPEIIAEYTAKLAKNCSVIDGFCGSGGNVIQFSKYCSEVFAIDIDPKKLEICKNNCKIYNCKNNIHFIEYDFLMSKLIIFFYLLLGAELDIKILIFILLKNQ